MLDNFQYLNIDLPEDIKALKYYGDFEEAKRIIDLRLQKLDGVLKERLLLEKEILDVLGKEYRFNYDEALVEVRSKISDFTEEEFKKYEDEGFIGWIFKNGKKAYINSFADNLLKVRPELEARKIGEVEQREISHFGVLDEVVAKMKSEGSASYKIEMKESIKIEKDAERIGEKILVHIPIPNASTQVKNVEILEYSPKDAYIAQFEHRFRTISFDTTLEADQEFFVRYSYEMHNKYVELDPNMVPENHSYPEELKEFTKEKLPHIAFTPYLKEVYKEYIGDETNPVKIARAAYDFVTTNVMYQYVRPYFTILDIPTYCATNRKGDCGLQALVFITLCRMGGIPARWQSGLFTSPAHCGNHDWAQIYIEPYGWAFGDCSFGGAAYRAGSMDRWNFYFGNLDPFRMVANTDFQCEYDPPKKQLSQDPYDNQCGEVEYEDRGLRRSEYESKKEILKIGEI